MRASCWFLTVLCMGSLFISLLPTCSEASRSGRRRVAILGGGLSGLSTAWQITNDAKHRDSVEVTVYTMGWRLGGKAASARSANDHNKVFEHGLHMFFGCYDYAFGMMRSVYEELGRSRETHPFAEWTDAFKKADPKIMFMECFNGEWLPWELYLPHNPLVPGSALKSDTTPSEARVDSAMVFKEAAALLTRHLAVLTSHWKSHWQRAAISSLMIKLNEHPLHGVPSIALLEDIKLAMDALHAIADEHPLVMHITLIRRTYQIVDLTLAAMHGLIADDAFAQGIDHLDQYDMFEWLQLNGLSQASLANPLVRGLYSLVFGFESGDSDSPNLAAGVAVRIAVVLSTGYKGAAMWKMMSGMGDIVIEPLYEVLRRRGVQFRFFSKVRDLKLDKDSRKVQTVHIDTQATVKEGEFMYEPRIRVILPGYQQNSILSWPSAPLFDQLVEGDALRRSSQDLESSWSTWEPVSTQILRCGEDFDDVVLAMSLDPLRKVGEQLIASSHKWRIMLQNLRSVATVGVQLWFTKPADEIVVSEHVSVSSAFETPLDTIASMNAVLNVEDWGKEVGMESTSARSLFYMCGPFPELPNDTPQAARDRLWGLTASWIDKAAHYMWKRPSFHWNNQFVWDMMVAPEATPTYDRLAHQFAIVNMDMSQRYVQSIANTTQYRLQPGQTEFDNVFVAGDWTRSRFNSGCAEAAVHSGVAAGRSLLKTLPEMLEETPSEEKYAYRMGDPSPPPFFDSDNSISFLMLDCCKKKLQVWVDKFNDDSGLRGPFRRFRPIGGFVLLALNSGRHSVGRNRASFDEKSIVVFVPVFRMDFFTFVALEVPIIVVDDPMSLVIGREQCGFPKAAGRVSITRASDLRAGEAFVLADASVYGVPDFAVADPEYLYAPFLKVSYNPSSPTAPPTLPVHSIEELLKIAYEWVPSFVYRFGLPTGFFASDDNCNLAFCESSSRAQSRLACLRIPLVLLFQIASNTGGDRAALKELIDFGLFYALESIRVFTNHQDIDVEWQHLDSFPVLEELGLKVRSKPRFAFVFNGVMLVLQNNTRSSNVLNKLV